MPAAAEVEAVVVVVLETVVKCYLDPVLKNKNSIQLKLELITNLM